MKDDYKLIFEEDENRTWRRFFFAFAALAAIFTICIINEIKTSYNYSKIKEIARIEGNIDSYEIIEGYSRYGPDYELNIKLKGYKCIFYFNNNDFGAPDWKEIENETGKNKDCKIGILVENKNILQEDKYVEIEELQVGEKEYINWLKIKEYHHKSVYVEIAFAVVGLGVCIFFVYLALNPRN